MNHQGEHRVATTAQRSAHPLPILGAAEGTPEHLLMLMMASSRLMMLEAARAVPELRLTPPQFRILNYVYRCSGTSLSQVAAQLGVRLPTASVMLVKLAEDGLVTRDRDPASRRRMRLELTDKGRAAIERVRETLFARLTTRLEGLTPEARRAVDAALPALERLFQP